MIKCLLTEFRSDQTGKYLALGPLSHDLGPNIFRPSHSVNKYIARDFVREMRKKTTKFIPEFTFFLRWYYDQKIISFFSSDFESVFANT